MKEIEDGFETALNMIDDEGKSLIHSQVSSKSLTSNAMQLFKVLVSETGK